MRRRQSCENQGKECCMGMGSGKGVRKQCVQRPCGRKELRGPLDLTVGVMRHMQDWEAK